MMPRGGSGARVVMGDNDDSVWKYDTVTTNGRVREQGAWLREVDPDTKIECLPLVHRVVADGYEMERLTDRLDENLANIDESVETIFRALGELWYVEPGLWRKQRFTVDEYGVYDFSLRQHVKYLGWLTRQTGTRPILRDLTRYAHRIDWVTLKRCQTHGDPIIDNLLWRVSPPSKRSIPVLVDPVPSTAILPPVKALDVGRLIQSALGYELIKYDRGGVTTDHNAAEVKRRAELVINMAQSSGGFSVNEARAAAYWAVVHMLRGVRTALPRERVANRLRAVAYITLDHVVKPWMR
jgi:hypothetical protein